MAPLNRSGKCLKPVENIKVIVETRFIDAVCPDEDIMYGPTE